MGDYRRGLLAGLGVLALLVVLAAGVGIGLALADDDANVTDETTATTADSDEANGELLGGMGPSRIEDGVAMGFAHSEEGATAAAIAWTPWLLTWPEERRPDGLGAVVGEEFDPLGLGTGIAPAGGTHVTQVPLAVRVDEATQTDAVISLRVFGVGAAPGDPQVFGDVSDTVVTLQWSEARDDWQVQDLSSLQRLSDPVMPELFAGWEMIGFTGGRPAGPALMEVPGE